MPRDSNKFCICHIIALYIVLGFFPYAVFAGDYLNSSHGDSSTGVNRASMAGYSTGNCGHCHEQHMSLDGQEPDPTGSSPDPYLGFGIEQDLCFYCHGNAGAAISNTIEDDFGLSYPHGYDGITNYMTTYDDRHKANENATTAFDAVNRHAECMDCHNPHKATAIDTVAYTYSQSPIIGATGIDATNPSWTTPTYSNFGEVTDRYNQYKICFKCHSSWAGVGTGTDTSQEFSTGNASYHNVKGDNNPPSDDNYGNFNPTWVYKMMPRYSSFGIDTGNNSTMNTNLRNVTMICSDCHGNSDTSAQGIHGSDISSILKVPVGSPYNSWNYANEVGDADVWCFNCHIAAFTNSGFSGPDGSLHTSKHNGKGYCTDCHVAVPHGSVVPHLLKPIGYFPANGFYNRHSNGSGVGIDATLGNWNNSGDWRESSPVNQSCAQNGHSHQNCDGPT